MSALFLSHIGGDLTCAVGRDDESGLPYACERFAGAFDHRYRGKSGSIYVLLSDGFVEGKTKWSEEVVREEAVAPIEEIFVEDTYQYLLDFVDAGRLLLSRFPDRKSVIPDDDEDLVIRGITWSRRFGDNVLSEFRKYHPHLVPRILQGIEEGKYTDEI